MLTSGGLTVLMVITNGLGMLSLMIYLLIIPLVIILKQLSFLVLHT